MTLPGFRPTPVPPSPEVTLSSARPPAPPAVEGHVRVVQQSAPLWQRRRTVFVLGRAAALLVADLLATAFVLAIAKTVGGDAADLVFGAALAASAGSHAVLSVSAVVLTAFLVVGTYRPRSGAHSRFDLLVGSALAVAATAWPALVSAPSAALVAAMAWIAIALFGNALVLRGVADAVVRLGAFRSSGGVPTVLVGERNDLEESPGYEQRHWLNGFRVVAHVHAPRAPITRTRWRRLEAVIRRHRAHTVVIGESVPASTLVEVAAFAMRVGCTVLYPARAAGLVAGRANLVWYGGEPFFEIGAPLFRSQELFLKRLLDFTGAALGLLVAAPLMAVIAVLVKLDSPGPVLFAQRRAGLHGRRFRMLKFRTMHADADARKLDLAHLNQSGDSRLFKVPNDPRITRLGALLRRWSLDELPQLWNVLVGDMSLVGPRPFFESDLADYEAHHFRRLDVKPGITGLWQVNGRSDVVDFEEVVRLDREYIGQWSLWLDLSILVRTVPAVLRRRGAY